MGCWGRLLFGKCGKTRGKKNSQIVRVNWHAVCSRMHPRIRIRGRSNDELELRRACYQNAVMRGWNGWYHCTCNTYGTWLRGDPRGWRTRHDRERVEGDYRHPSKPGTWERRYQRSQQLMRCSPLHLTREQQCVAVDAIVRTLRYHGVEALVVALDRQHLHVLARFGDHRPRKWLGVAKKNAARELLDRGLVGEGGSWGKRSQSEPIRDRAHQIAVFRYILRHGAKGATVWDFRMKP